MDPEPPALIPTQRHKCSACYKQFKKKEHLIEHMQVSFHSIHDPKCGVCKKHCKSLESVREHLTGPLPKGHCSKVFATNGCDICLTVFDCSDALNIHKNSCRLSPARSPEPMPVSMIDESVTCDMDISGLSLDNNNDQITKVIAMDCEMVGGGSDGSLNLCGRVCLVDEDENVVFHSYVKPQIPVTDYRHQITGITEEHMEHASPLSEVTRKVEEILHNGEAIWKVRLEGGKASILVGHSLDHDLDCLRLNYPDHLIRDTAKYQPLMKTNLISHSLKYLTQKYLGYELQIATHDPYEDSVAALRIYKRMRSQAHLTDNSVVSSDNNNIRSRKDNVFQSRRMTELEALSPNELLAMSSPNYRCWCLDGRKTKS